MRRSGRASCSSTLRVSQSGVGRGGGCAWTSLQAASCRMLCHSSLLLPVHPPLHAADAAPSGTSPAQQAQQQAAPASGASGSGSAGGEQQQQQENRAPPPYFPVQCPQGEVRLFIGIVSRCCTEEVRVCRGGGSLEWVQAQHAEEEWGLWCLLQQPVSVVATSPPTAVSRSPPAGSSQACGDPAHLAAARSRPPAGRDSALHSGAGKESQQKAGRRRTRFIPHHPAPSLGGRTGVSALTPQNVVSSSPFARDSPLPRRSTASRWPCWARRSSSMQTSSSCLVRR